MVYAVLTTRAVDLNWQMRALRVLPMFVFPGLSYAIYFILGGFTRMRTHTILNFLLFLSYLCQFSKFFLQNKEMD